ncbi:tail protein X [Sphingomonas sp. R647]|uniref:tail protein X n=1 Tax=Sphingomonas sp. R647 TaxID=2875233 RepID=UPI001CD29474|nr:tail protein X [Sphingomonas sp. R647]MCA1199129.1 tail protein X [Sphingomonas sp. R647]
MAAMTVPARQGERLDQLVWRAIGGGPAAVEVVLGANRGLAGLGPVLPEGRAVLIPETSPAAQRVELVQLWD